MRTDTIPVPEKAPPAMLVTVTLPTFSGISRADETILYQSLICIAGTFVIE